MEEITEQNLIDIIKEQFPKFNPYWESYINHWGDDNGLTIQMFPLIDFVLDVIKSNDEKEIERVFNFIEFLMCEGNDYAQTAIATGFLEGLVNHDPDEIQFINFAQYLGKKTVAHLRAWNAFHGAKTEGI